MTKQNEIQEQKLVEEVEKVSKDVKKPSFFKTTRGAVTLALIGGVAIGATLFSMPNADAAEETENAPVTESVMTSSCAAPTDEMMVQSDENGTKYSTDGGETWTEGMPPCASGSGSSSGCQGKSVQSSGTSGTIEPAPAPATDPASAPAPVPGEEGGMMIRTEADGTSEYSTDGGATWTEGLPPGSETVTNPDGSQGVVVSEPSPGSGN